jgi:hypothetical protein
LSFWVWAFLARFVLVWAFLTLFLDLLLFMPFIGLVFFPSYRWSSWAFLNFCSSSCASLGLGFEIQTLCFCVVNGLIKEEIEKPSCQFLDLIVMSHWLGEVLPLSLFYLENHICLCRCVQVAGTAWRAADRGRSRKPGAGDRGWLGTGRVLGGRTIGRSGDAVCGLHRAWGDEKHEFLGWASKPRSMVCQLFGIKITGTICQSFYLKTIGMICQWFDFKSTGMVSSSLASKPVVTVSPGLDIKTGS